ncbi:MAG: hypothetical protein IPP94_18320 [Ignavibacteria bacterium]|nr:hypothetical protein [Ignavibacteria bacterium]
MLHETNEYARALGESFTVCLVSPHYAWNPVGDTKTPFAGEYAHLDIEVIPRDQLVSGGLESLHPDSFDVIIIIGEHAATETVEDIDTRSIMILLLLHARRREGGGDSAAIAHRQIVVEIHHHENREVAASIAGEHDVIITNELVSRMIAQLCREPGLEEVFRDLFDVEGAEVYFKPVHRYASDGDTASFGSLMAAALAAGETAIGFDDPRRGADACPQSAKGDAGSAPCRCPTVCALGIRVMTGRTRGRRRRASFYFRRNWSTFPFHAHNEISHDGVSSPIDTHRSSWNAATVPLHSSRVNP